MPSKFRRAGGWLGRTRSCVVVTTLWTTAFSSGVADAQTPTGSEVSRAGVAQPGEPEPLYAVPTRRDRVGRVLAPVLVNGQGPFRFILDTGANRSVLSQRVLTAVGLALAADGPSIAVHGVTGTAVLPAVRLDVLQSVQVARTHGAQMED